MKLFGLEIKRVNELTIPEHISGSVYLDNLGGLAYSARSRTIRSNYENAFAPATAIEDEVIKRGVHLASPNDPDKDISTSQPIWNALTRPNDRMGWLKFLQVLTSGFMVLPELSLLLWHSDGSRAVAGCPEGGFTLNTISGFTVLPRGSRYDDGSGREQWRITTRKYGIQTFGKESVITLKYSLLPDDGITGVSPGSSSAQEASIRDALNQYERGFFDNGAKPSIIVTINARSNEEFQKIRDSYEAANRGAGRQNGAVYQKVIVSDTMIGAVQPSISVTPVGSVNDSLAINDIVGFTSQTINANYGVSPIIFGDASTTTYQNQQLVDRKFMARVQSVMVRLFAEFERELERVTKTKLTFTFSWDSTDVELTDELKVKAQTRVSNASALKQLIELGADSDKAVEALCLGEEWLGLNLAKAAPPVEPTEPANNPPAANATTGRKKRVAERQVELVNRVREQLLDIAQHRLEYASGKVAAALMPSEADYVEALLGILQELANAGGVTTARQLAQEIKDYKVGTSYEMSAEAFALIKSRATEVIGTYSNLLDEQIAKLKESDPEGWIGLFEASVAAGLIYARIEAVTVGETKNAFQAGQLDNAVNIQKQYRDEYPDANARIIKTWHATGASPCEFCAGMEGVQAGVQDTFVPDGLIHGHDGATLVLDTDYTDGTLPDAHVNCQCTFGFTVEVNRD